MNMLLRPLAVVVLSALLSACSGGGPTPGPDPAPPADTGSIEPAVISGPVTGERLLPGTVILGSLREISAANIGQLSADGTLTLNLTAAPDDASRVSLLPPPGSGCTFTGTGSGSPMVAWFSRMYAFSVQKDPLGSIVQTFRGGATLDGSVVARVYSDGPATVKGVAACGEDVVDYDVTLRAGWNAVEYAFSGYTQYLRTPQPTARTALIASAFTPSVNIQLPESELTFTNADPVTMPARFYQEGAISGEVQLSTDVPGLSVEPATLTLPALSGQGAATPAAAFLGGLGLGAQRLDTPLTFRYTGRENGSRSFTLTVRDGAGTVVGSHILRLTVARRAVSVSGPGYPLDLRAGTSVDVPVRLEGSYGFGGPVTVTALDLPRGVSATPVTVDVRGVASTTLTVRAAADAAPGQYAVTVRAAGDGVESTFTLGLNILRPVAQLSLVNGGAELTRGQSGTVDVAVESTYGFQGSVTVTLGGLPAGVSASPATVTVPAGGTVTARVPVRVGTSAALGRFAVTASTGSGVGGATGTLDVMPPSTDVGPTVTGMAGSGGGVWLLTASTLDPSSGAETATFGRYVGGARVAQATVPNSGTRLVAARDGDLLSLGGDGGGTRVDTTGTLSAFRHPLTLADVLADRVDAHGQVWFLRPGSVGTTATQALCVWTVSGTTSTCPHDLGAAAFTRLLLSDDGRTLLVQSGQDRRAFRVDTAARTLAPVDVGGSAQEVRAVAVRDDGSIWTVLPGGLPALRRVNVDGSVQTVTLDALDVDSFVGFDRAAPDTLWGLGSAGIQRLDVKAGTQTTLPLRGVQQLRVLDGGGVAALTAVSTLEGTTWRLALLP